VPFKSKAQMRKFYAMESKGELSKGTAKEWAHKTPNTKKLPEKVNKMKTAAELDEMLRGSGATTGQAVGAPVGGVGGAILGSRVGGMKGGLIGGLVGAIGTGYLGNYLGGRAGQSQFEGIQERAQEQAMREQMAQQGWLKGASMDTDSILRKFAEGDGDGAGVLQQMKARQSQEAHDQQLRHNEELHGVKMEMQQIKLDQMQQPTEGEEMPPQPPPPPAPEMQPGQAEMLQQVMANRPRAQMPEMEEQGMEEPGMEEPKMGSVKTAGQIADGVLHKVLASR
jgi:uncharacterized protein YcfJ